MSLSTCHLCSQALNVEEPEYGLDIYNKHPDYKRKAECIVKYVNFLTLYISPQQIYLLSLYSHRM